MDNLQLIGPGGRDGEALLGSLAGEDCDGILACTMSLHGEWLLRTLKVRPTTCAVIACHHPVRCWSGVVADRSAVGAVTVFPNASLAFPPERPR